MIQDGEVTMSDNFNVILLFFLAYGTHENIEKHQAIILHRKYLEDSGIVPKGYKNRSVGTKVVAKKAVSFTRSLLNTLDSSIHLAQIAFTLYCFINCG
jgi:hypothetical protein